MSESDRDYYQRRIVQETSAAEQTSDENARQLHRELAAYYVERLAGVPAASAPELSTRPAND